MTPERRAKLCGKAAESLGSVGCLAQAGNRCLTRMEGLASSAENVRNLGATVDRATRLSADPGCSSPV
jgi:hypothetical protein